MVEDDGEVFERFTELARLVVVFAQEEARILKHDHVGTEHILLGLLCVEEGLAARVLESLEVSVEEVRSQVVRIVGLGVEATSGQIPFAADAKRVLELSLREAQALGDNIISTGHILLALVGEKETLAVRVLGEVGLEAQTTRDGLIHAIESWSPERVSGGRLRLPRVPDELLDSAGALLHRLVREVEEDLGRPADAGDLLVLLASVQDGLAARTLTRAGVDAGILAAAARESRAESARSGVVADSPLLRASERARSEKEAAIAAQDFERAANLRHRELLLRRQAHELAEGRFHNEVLTAVRSQLGLSPG